MNIRTWIFDLADAYNHRLGNSRQIDIWEEEIKKLDLTEAEMESLRLQIIREVEKFPSLAQIIQIGRSATKTKAQHDVNWITFERDGKIYAKKGHGYYGNAQGPNDLPAIKANEGGRDAFLNAFLLAGGDLASLNLGTTAKTKDPEPIGSIIGRVLPDLDKLTPAVKPAEESVSADPEEELWDAILRDET